MFQASSNSGGNDADYNNGQVSLTTGGATSNVDVSTTANSNEASVGCCDNGGVNVEISGNVADPKFDEHKTDGPTGPAGNTVNLTWEIQQFWVKPILPKLIMMLNQKPIVVITMPISIMAT